MFNDGTFILISEFAWCHSSQKTNVTKACLDMLTHQTVSAINKKQLYTTADTQMPDVFKVIAFYSI